LPAFAIDYTLPPIPPPIKTLFFLCFYGSQPYLLLYSARLSRLLDAAAPNSPAWSPAPSSSPPRRSPPPPRLHSPVVLCLASCASHSGTSVSVTLFQLCCSPPRSACQRSARAGSPPVEQRLAPGAPSPVKAPNLHLAPVDAGTGKIERSSVRAAPLSVRGKKKGVGKEI
jgi:hypothetical protein